MAELLCSVAVLSITTKAASESACRPACQPAELPANMIPNEPNCLAEALPGHVPAGAALPPKWFACKSPACLPIECQPAELPAELPTCMAACRFANLLAASIAKALASRNIRASQSRGECLA